MKTKIEWCDYSINPVKGLCPMACSYCYARAMYKRFKWNETVRFQPGTFLCLPSDPAKVFVGSTIELFGPWVTDEWRELIFDAVKNRPQHTFICLTKQPQNLPKEWPDNCWVGVSATDYRMFADALAMLADIRATVRFISIEPMLERMNIPLLDQVLRNCHISWLIIGQQTPVRASTMPKIEWVREIVEAADKTGCAIFLKDNLGWPQYTDAGSAPFYKKHNTGVWILRQEFPRGTEGK